MRSGNSGRTSCSIASGRIWKKVNSGALTASGSDALFDAILSGSVLASAIVYLIWGVSLEAYVGVVIAGFIIKAGVEMMIETLNDIIGKREDAETVKELNRRGFAVGIISDLVGTMEVDEWLDADGLRPYFKTVQQSSVCYVRKPGPAIFYYAINEVGIPAEQSAFLGDNLDRDIVGAKAVNMGMTIAAKWGAKKYTLNAENRPDCVIFAFPQLLDLFPEPGKVNTDKLVMPETAWKGADQA